MCVCARACGVCVCASVYRWLCVGMRVCVSLYIPSAVLDGHPLTCHLMINLTVLFILAVNDWRHIKHSSIFILHTRRTIYFASTC